jgi:sn-glycerol 3-phosphate transport system substrate-binding protein
MKEKIRLVTVAATLAACALPALAQTEIQWWHSMTAVNNEWVNDLAKEFNAAQKDYKIVPTYKGSYDESMTAAIAAFRAGNAPHILQVFEVGTAPNGQMLSYPFNSSTTVFYYNRDAFKAAGIDPAKPPATWPEVAVAAAKLKASGHKCPFTPAWQGWTQLESFSAWHNVEFATKRNGLDGMDARMKVNSPLHVRHIENLANMAKQGLFIYKGRGSLAQASFTSGECAMITTSSGFYGDVKKNAKFAFGLAPLPYYPDVAGAPQNTVIGGASLWVMSGKKPAEYKGVAAFFAYLSSPEVQSASHKRTGYLPITTAAYELTEKSGFYKENPGTDVAVTQMVRKTTDKSRGIRLGNYLQIRAIEDEELEQVWAGKKSAKDALDDIVRRGNEQLERFQKANKG